MVSILRQLMLKLAQKRGMVAKADRELEIENPTPPVRARIQKKRMKDQQEVERLEQEIRDKVGPDGKLPEGFFEGGMVGSAPPRISRGLSGLIRNYSTGPLARMSVPRETPMGMFRGGAPGMRDVGFRGPQRIPDIDIDQSAIAAALAALPEAIKPGGRPMLDRNVTPDIPPPPPVPTNIAIQTPSPGSVTAAEALAALEQQNTAAEVPAQTNPAVKTAAENLANRTAIGPVTPMDLTGQRPTDFLGYETTEGVAELATAPGQTPFEPGVLIGGTGTTEPVDDTGMGDKSSTAQEGLDKTVAVDPVAETTQANDPFVYVDPVATQDTTATTTDPAATTTQTTTETTTETFVDPVSQAVNEAAAQAAAQTTTTDPVTTGPTAAEVLAQEVATAEAAATQAQETRVETAADKIETAETKQIIADTAAENLVEATNAGADAATVETLTLDADLKQQDADAAALEAELAVAADPDPIYTGPTQGELLEASEQAKAAAGDLFTTPTDTGQVIDRGSFGAVDTVGTADTGMQNATTDMYVAADGTVFTSGTLGRQYDQQLQANQQGGIMSFLGQPNFDVSSAISEYTTGYPSSQDMLVKQTFYPFQQLTDEQKENAYIAEVFKPVPRQNVGVGSLRFRDVQGRSTTETGTGTDTSEKPTGDLDTGAPASAPGEYGLDSNQMYQCKTGYTLKFINGKAMCVPNQAQDPDGGRATPYEADVVDLGGGS